jgi:hypothetical protein
LRSAASSLRLSPWKGVDSAPTRWHRRGS